LQLTSKGHLAVGADADVAIYTPDENRQTMFELPRTVLKAGETILDQGELRASPQGGTLFNTPAYDADRLPAVKEWFEDHYSLRFANYAV
jgi:formylmethanofuran dehydrogenase subunit A